MMQRIHGYKVNGKPAFFKDEDKLAVLNVEIKATGIEIAKQKLLELHSIVLDLKRLGLKNKTINLLVKDISLKVSDE